MLAAGKRSGALRPDKAAQRGAQDILDTMKDAVRADYQPLQAALVKQFGAPETVRRAEDAARPA